MKILVTGGAGFIGSAVVRFIISQTDASVINLDALTYAGDLSTVADVAGDDRYAFCRADICDADGLREAVAHYQPDAIMHLAAESHVDRSIDGPAAFVHTNINGTHTLLEVAQAYWQSLSGARQERFRFHHISTDEVFGSLGAQGRFTEESAYRPNSPYSASKAASDHLVRAWYKTYGLPVVMSNCSNNYGPFQFPEKLIPLTITRAVAGRSLPVYGTGANVRDWLHVEDHARALYRVLTRGLPGESYNIGGNSERTNLQVVQGICRILDGIRPVAEPHEKLITFVADRPGHDARYAIDASKARRELDWQPEQTFETGLESTVRWYLDNMAWCAMIAERYDGERLGLSAAEGNSHA